MTVDTATPTFPVEWKNPDDAQVTWFRDEMHFPEPLTPLTQTLLLETFDEGNPLACDELAMPMSGLLYGWFNGYAYNMTRPVPESEMPARMERHQQVMPERMDNLRRLWDEQYLQRVVELTDEIDSLELEHAPTGDVAARLTQLREALVELWHIHFLVVFPKLGCGERFFGLYQAATGSRDETAAYRCLQGFPNKSVEAGKELWELSRLAAEDEGVRTAVTSGNLDALEGSPFKEALERYLDAYGRRANGIELAFPLWLETPEFVLGLVRSYLTGERGDPDPGLEKFFGKAGPPELDGEVLRGAPASAGRVTGTARVIERIDQLDRVQAGDILVCRSTTPPWTPIFGSITALVTDTGGVLSHGAIVAREYRLPAVVGTKIGTRVIVDGQTITVDGEHGEVLLAPN
jgi:phosphohistidine swiveling domain-containing protein